MSIIKSLDETSSSAAKAGQDYISTTRKYYELKVFQMVSLLSSYVVKCALFGSLLILGFIFMAVAGASAIGEYLGSMALGHLFVGLIFILLGVLVFIGRKIIDKFIIKKLSKTYFES